jgi:MFS family permease
MLIWFLWFMGFVLRSIFSPLLPLIEDEFMVPHAAATSIFGFVSLGYAISVFFSGTFARLIGYRKSILLSVLVSGVVFCLIALVGHFQVLYPLSLILGLAAGLYLPSVIPIITDYYEERLWARTIATHGSAASMAVFASPFIALFLLSFMPWRGIFLVLGGVMFGCTVIFYLATHEVKMEKNGSYFLFSILKRREFWVMGVAWIFSAGCNLGLYLVTPLYLVKELSMDMQHANAVFGASRLGGAALTLAAGFFIDRFSLKKGVFLMMLSTGILTMLMTVSDIGMVKIFLFLQATISPVAFPIGLLAITRLFSREERGQATGFIVTLGLVGTGVIPYLLGLSGDFLTFRFGIFVLGLMTALSSGLVLLLKKLP